MITFLNMAFLLGIPLVGLPVLVHLLNRRRREVIDWGAMQFLLEALPRQRRFWQADDRLLMILRCLALLLFLLAIAQPLLRSRWFGTSGQRDIVLVVDGSMSTARRAGQGIAFDQITTQAAKVISDLGESDRVRILLAGQVPQWLTPELTRLNSQSRTELRALVQQLKPTAGSVDWARCLDEAAVAMEDPHSVHGVVVLTDEQAHGWRPEAGSTWRGLRDEFDLSHAGAAVNVVGTNAPGTGANLAVNSITTLRTRVGVAEPLSFSATIRNAGTAPSEPAMLSWLQGQTPLGVSQVKSLSPGESTAAEFEHSFDGAGVFEIRAHIDQHDALDADNEWANVVEVIESIPVLIVDGSTAHNTIENQVQYILAALGRQSEKDKHRWRSVFHPRVIQHSAFTDDDLSLYPCIVLANVSQLDGKMIDRVHQFVDAGGGLWLLPGDGLDRTRFNSTFCTGPSALLPTPLGEPVGDANDGQHFERIVPPVEPHPSTVLLGDTQRLDLDRVQVRRHYQLPLPASDKETSVLLKLSNNSPVAVHRMLGRGHVILQTVPMGTAWSNSPLHQAYVVWVSEWLAWLASPSATRWNLDAGQPVSLPLDKTFSAGAELSTPSGEKLHVDSELLQGRRVFRSDGVSVPGRYQFIATDGQGGKHSFPLIVQRDPEESDLTALKPEQKQSLSSAAGVRFVSNPLEGIQGTGSVLPKSEPIWTPLLMSLIVLMIVELLLAGRLTRRRLAPVPPIERESIMLPARSTARSA